MIHRGQQALVRLRNGDSVSGWLYAETPVGIYVALDRSGDNIRFVPSGSWESARFSYDDVVDFRGAADAQHRGDGPPGASEAVIRSTEAALQQTDYNAMRRLYAGLRANVSYFRGWYDGFHFEMKSEEESPTLGDVAVSVRLLYSELLAELERSGLDHVIREHSDELRQLAGRYVLPYFDLLFAPEDDGERRFVFEALVANVRAGDLVRECDLGRRLLRQVTNANLIRLPDMEEAYAEEVKNPSETPRRLRKASAVGKMAVGGALAAANVTAGVFAGIVSALPTLGIGAVAGALTVATSAYTGLNSACDGLKDLAAAIEQTG